MKKKLLASALLSAMAPAVFAQDLLITGIIDGPGSGGNPKALELLALSDIPDLSQYGIESASNGGASSGVPEYIFPAQAVSAGQYIYLQNTGNGGDAEFNNYFGFDEDFLTNQLGINGNDTVLLYFNNVVSDVYGQVGVDGTGTFWDYLDGWAVRDPSITTPNATFTESEWIFSGINVLDGETTNATAATPFPLAGSISDTPPEEEQPPAEPPLVLISAVQGNPTTYGTNNFGDVDVSPIIGELVTVEGVVVGDFQDGDTDETRNLRGFYLMEEVADQDTDPTSSEGVFIFDNTFGVDVNVGDVVRVSGTVNQNFGETQINNITAVTVVAPCIIDPAAAVADLVTDINLSAITDVTLSQNDDFQPDLESYEGMLVRFPETLTITEQFQLDRFNEIRLVAGERPRQFTQENAPSAAGFDAQARLDGARSIVFDDGLNFQNQNVSGLFQFPYTEAVAPRMGDQIVNLSGVLDYKFAGNGASGSTWRVRGHLDGVNTFTSTAEENSPNPRTAAPEDVGGNLKVASMNVLNFFTTIDLSGVSTAIGMDPRGADTTEEFDRQLVKLANAIVAIDADVIGLIEIENEFNSTEAVDTAVEALIAAVNTQLGSEVYAFVNPGVQFVGSDAIAVAMIYKPAAVEIAEGSTIAMLNDTIAATLPGFETRDFAADPLFEGPATSRVPLAATFESVETGDLFTVVVNHYKSKGQSGLNDETSPNFDQGDGAGFWNARRLETSQAVSAWLATNPTGIVDGDMIVMGDLNSYAQEEPVQFLLGEGFVNVEGAESNSFVFDGQTGTLDYILVSDELNAKVNDVTVWNINSDEADALDYNLDFGKEASYFDGTTATRYSDHDPVIVGFNLESPNQAPVADAGTAQTVTEGATVTLDASASTDDAAVTAFSWTQVSGPAVTLTGADTATPTFTAPEVDAETVLVFEVTVSDAEGETATAMVAVTVNDVPNQAPVADAGADQTVDEESTVTLAGSGTDPEAGELTFEWDQVSGPSVSLSGADTATASFTAPSLTSDQDLVFELTVTDAQGLSSTDQVTVTVVDVANVPADNGDRKNIFGCSFGGGNAPVDPTLPFAALLALLFINRKKFAKFIRS